MDPGHRGGYNHPPGAKIQEVTNLVDIPETQRRMDQKDLERLVEKIHSMHLVVPGAVAHLFQIQCAMTQGGVDQAWLSPALHCEIADCRGLTLQAAARPTDLANIFCREPTHLGFCNASGIGAGEVWIYPA